MALAIAAFRQVLHRFRITNISIERILPKENVYCNAAKHQAKSSVYFLRLLSICQHLDAKINGRKRKSFSNSNLLQALVLTTTEEKNLLFFGRLLKT